MAAKQVTTSTVNWDELANKVPVAQKPVLNAFKSKHNGYLQAVSVLPDSLPKIDFDSYKGRITVPGMVEDFQKKYESLAIPYPQDTMSAANSSHTTTRPRLSDLVGAICGTIVTWGLTHFISSTYSLFILIL